MATAKLVDIKCDAIPEEWLLTPESTELEKENKQLLKEIKRLHEISPKLLANCVDSNGNDLKEIHHNHTYYKRLSEDEIISFIDKLKQYFPFEKDFERYKHRKVDSFGGAVSSMLIGNKTFSPASEKEIQKYKDEEYPKWIAKCENVLRNLHENMNLLQEKAKFFFEATNTGTYPGKNVQVNIIAKGSIMITPLEETGENEREQTVDTLFPQPPKSPQGQWMPQLDFIFNSLGGTSSILKHLPKHSSLMSNDVDIKLPFISHKFNQRRDPNSFYWKPSRPLSVQSSFSLECDQWRHGDSPEKFNGIVHFNQNEGELSGAIEINIHAENLPDVFKKTIGVKIDIHHESVFQKANELIELCIKKFQPHK